MDALLRDVHNLTVQVINEKLFEKKLREKVQAEIKTILATIKSNNTSLEKLRNILMLHLNKIGIFTKHELIEIALAVISSHGKEGDAELSDQKPAVEQARKLLDFQIQHLDNEGIDWIRKNFDRLVALYSETKPAIRKLYHKILEDLEITSSEEELIIKLINHGLTTSMTRNQEIIFEGRRYKLKTQHATQLLDRIATAVINQEKDILAPQYKAHKPIFEKRHESGMKKASSDIETVYSVIDKTQELVSDQWILAEMREQPEGARILFLLEKRNPIGDHVVYRLSQSSHEKLRAIRIDDEDPRKELEEIFGKYVVGKKFKGRSVSVAIDIGNQLLKNDLRELEKLFGSKDVKEYFQQELLGLGSTDRIDSMDKELSTKLTDYEKVLASKLTDKISQENQLKIKEYFRAFVETFASAYTAAQVVDSGQVQLNSSMETKVLSTLISFVPFAGDALSQVTASVGEFINSRDMIKNARTMKKLAIDGTNLSQLVSEAAMKIVLTESKQNEIIKITDEDLEKISGKLMEKISKFISNFNVKIDELLYTKKFSTAAAKLGNNDASTLIGHWVNQKIQSQDRPTLQSHFVKRVTEPTVSDETTKEETTTRSKTACCSLF